MGGSVAADWKVFTHHGWRLPHSTDGTPFVTPIFLVWFFLAASAEMTLTMEAKPQLNWDSLGLQCLPKPWLEGLALYLLLLRGGGTFKRWGLVEGLYVLWSVSLKGIC